MTPTFSLIPSLKLRVRAKLSLGLAVVLALMLVVGGLSALQLRAQQQTAVELNGRWLPTVRWTLQLRALMNEFRTQEFENILAADKDERVVHGVRMDTLKREIAAVQANYGTLPGADADSDQKKLWTSVLASWVDYLAEQEKIRKLADADMSDTARSLIRGKSQTLFASTMANLDKIVANGVQRSEEGTTRSQQDYVRALGSAGAAMLVALAVGILLAWKLGKNIAVPLARAAQVATQVSRGDLTVVVATDRHDEIGDLFAALQTMVRNLSTLVADVRDGVGTISGASTEIAAGTHNLSERTERQSSELQEASSSVDRLMGTASQNSALAIQAHTLASASRELAADGGRIVDGVVARMGDISTSSKRIGEITGVIDSIAFQTNILALNAAVEAARAGEQGRGFAVVASEVRTLAQRSGQAAKEIRGLIADSVMQVDAGAVLVGDAGKTMHEIVLRIGQLSTLAEQMAASSASQRDGTADINRTLGLLDDTAQQNAAMVEQTASASVSLREQAERLSEAVAVFRS